MSSENVTEQITNKVRGLIHAIAGDIQIVGKCLNTKIVHANAFSHLFAYIIFETDLL